MIGAGVVQPDSFAVNFLVEPSSDRRARPW